jgi:single-strand DNA-binding protein
MEAEMVNKIFLLGKVQDEVKMNYTSTGKAVARFTLVTEKEVDGRDPIRAFHRVVAWNRLAENCSKYLNKNKQVFLEGEMSYGSYMGQDGHKKYTADVQAYRAHFLDGVDNSAIHNDDGGDKNGNVASEFPGKEIPF